MIISQVGGSASFASTSGGKITAFNAISTAPDTVAPANPMRRKITFHNPGTINIFVAPAQQYNSSGSLVTLTPSTGALGGCFLVYADGGTLVIEGECQQAWQAFSASAANNPLTVMDSNVA